MTAQHTPGPWTADFGPRYAIVSADVGVTIGSIGNEAVAWQANARLIAAAPDYDKASRKLIAAFDELQATTTAERIITGRSDAALRKASNEAIAELRAAIAKATGQ